MAMGGPPQQMMGGGYGGHPPHQPPPPQTYAQMGLQPRGPPAGGMMGQQPPPGMMMGQQLPQQQPGVMMGQQPMMGQPLQPGAMAMAPQAAPQYHHAAPPQSAMVGRPASAGGMGMAHAGMAPGMAMAAAAAGTPRPQSEWTEHKAPSGIPYFYNGRTGESTYQRPAALQQPGAGAQPAAPPARRWNVYTDESSGRRYYSDGTTVTWVRPPELGPDDAASAGTAPPAQAAAGATPSSTPKRPSSLRPSSIGGADGDGGGQRKKKKVTLSLYSSRAEAVAAFKGLLLAKDVAPTTKWNDVVRLCGDDARWEACTTAGERKQALAEYQTRRANELRDVKRQERARAKEAYQKMLNDLLGPAADGKGGPGGTTKKFVPGSSRFGDVRDSLSKDDRFHAVDDEETREELYYEFVEELRKREERTRRGRIREAKEGFVAFLRSREGDGKLTFASTWSSFLGSLDATERSDTRFVTSGLMSDTDRQVYFSDHVIELQNAEDEKRRRIRDARRRAEKAQRDAFREMLRDMAKSGHVVPQSRWSAVEDKIVSGTGEGDGRGGPGKSDAILRGVQEQGREVARELFEDFVYDWRESYRRDRSDLSRAWERRAKGVELDPSLTAEEFGRVLLEICASDSGLYGEIRRMGSGEGGNPVSSVRLYFDELKGDSGGGAVRGGSRRDEESSEDEGEIKEDEAES